MDVSGLVGTELKSVCFVEDFLELGFGEAKVTLYAWPYVMLTEFSVAYGEPEYRNALCAQIGEEVTEASLEELAALTIELANGVVLGLEPARRRYRCTGERKLLGEWSGGRCRGVLAMANGFGLELEEMGMVGLIAVLLVPGVVWIANGKSSASMFGRMAVVGGLIAAAVTVEAAMDHSAEELAE